MRIGFRNINYYLDGGAMAAPELGGAPMPPEEQGGAPMPPEGGAPEGAPQGGDPMEMLMQLAQMAMQALQGQDANMAMQVCEGLVQFIQQVQGGGQGAPEGGAPAPEEQGEPVYKKGGKLSRRIKNTSFEKCGGKVKNNKKC